MAFNLCTTRKELIRKTHSGLLRLNRPFKIMQMIVIRKNKERCTGLNELVSSQYGRHLAKNINFETSYSKCAANLLLLKLLFINFLHCGINLMSIRKLPVIMSLDVQCFQLMFFFNLIFVDCHERFSPCPPFTISTSLCSLIFENDSSWKFT